MKSLLSIAAIVCSLFLSTNSFAQQQVKKETIKVWGNCGMCKSKIEKAAKKAGAATAVWNSKTSELKVSYSDANTSNQKIQQAVAEVGYDTQDVTADDKAYNNLHGCCKYERKEVKASYSCPMHTDVKSDKAEDKCSKCGMALEKDKK